MAGLSADLVQIENTTGVNLTFLTEGEFTISMTYQNALGSWTQNASWPVSSKIVVKFYCTVVKFDVVKLNFTTNLLERIVL